jgi:hypothetical protein
MCLAEHAPQSESAVVHVAWHELWRFDHPKVEPKTAWEFRDFVRVTSSPLTPLLYAYERGFVWPQTHATRASGSGGWSRVWLYAQMAAIAASM